MARPKRFERSTPAFGGQYSIQLSYGRAEGGKHSGFRPARPSRRANSLLARHSPLFRAAAARSFEVLAKLFSAVEQARRVPLDQFGRHKIQIVARDSAH